MGRCRLPLEFARAKPSLASQDDTKDKQTGALQIPPRHYSFLLSVDSTTVIPSAKLPRPAAISRQDYTLVYVVSQAFSLAGVLYRHWSLRILGASMWRCVADIRSVIPTRVSGP